MDPISAITSLMDIGAKIKAIIDQKLAADKAAQKLKQKIESLLPIVQDLRDDEQDEDTLQSFGKALENLFETLSKCQKKILEFQGDATAYGTVLKFAQAESNIGAFAELTEEIDQQIVSLQVGLQATTTKIALLEPKLSDMLKGRACKFWGKQFGLKREIMWDMFSASLQDDIGSLTFPQLAVIKSRLDKDSNGTISALEFSKFTRVLGYPDSFKKLLEIGEGTRLKYDDSFEMQLFLESMATKSSSEVEIQKARAFLSSKLPKCTTAGSIFNRKKELRRLLDAEKKKVDRKQAPELSIKFQKFLRQVYFFAGLEGKDLEAQKKEIETEEFKKLSVDKLLKRADYSSKMQKLVEHTYQLLQDNWVLTVGDLRELSIYQMKLLRLPVGLMQPLQKRLFEIDEDDALVDDIGVVGFMQIISGANPDSDYSKPVRTALQSICKLTGAFKPYRNAINILQLKLFANLLLMIDMRHPCGRTKDQEEAKVAMERMAKFSKELEEDRQASNSYIDTINADSEAHNDRLKEVVAAFNARVEAKRKSNRDYNPEQDSDLWHGEKMSTHNEELPKLKMAAIPFLAKPDDLLPETAMQLAAASSRATMKVSDADKPAREEYYFHNDHISKRERQNEVNAKIEKDEFILAVNALTALVNMRGFRFESKGIMAAVGLLCFRKMQQCVDSARSFSALVDLWTGLCQLPSFQNGCSLLIHRVALYFVKHGKPRIVATSISSLAHLFDNEVEFIMQKIGFNVDGKDKKSNSSKDNNSSKDKDSKEPKNEKQKAAAALAAAKEKEKEKEKEQVDYTVELVFPWKSYLSEADSFYTGDSKKANTHARHMLRELMLDIQYDEVVTRLSVLDLLNKASLAEDITASTDASFAILASYINTCCSPAASIFTREAQIKGKTDNAFNALLLKFTDLSGPIMKNVVNLLANNPNPSKFGLGLLALNVLLTFNLSLESKIVAVADQIQHKVLKLESLYCKEKGLTSAGAVADGKMKDFESRTARFTKLRGGQLINGTGRPASFFRTIENFTRALERPQGPSPFQTVTQIVTDALASTENLFSFGYFSITFIQHMCTFFERSRCSKILEGKVKPFMSVCVDGIPSSPSICVACALKAVNHNQGFEFSKTVGPTKASEPFCSSRTHDADMLEFARDYDADLNESLIAQLQQFVAENKCASIIANKLKEEQEWVSSMDKAGKKEVAAIVKTRTVDTEGLCDHLVSLTKRLALLSYPDRLDATYEDDEETRSESQRIDNTRSHVEKTVNSFTWLICAIASSPRAAQALVDKGLIEAMIFKDSYYMTERGLKECIFILEVLARKYSNGGVRVYEKCGRNKLLFASLISYICNLSEGESWADAFKDFYKDDEDYHTFLYKRQYAEQGHDDDDEDDYGLGGASSSEFFEGGEEEGGEEEDGEEEYDYGYGYESEEASYDEDDDEDEDDEDDGSDDEEDEYIDPRERERDVGNLDGLQVDEYGYMGEVGKLALKACLFVAPSEPVFSFATTPSDLNGDPHWSQCFGNRIWKLANRNAACRMSANSLSELTLDSDSDRIVFGVKLDNIAKVKGTFEFGITTSNINRFGLALGDHEGSVGYSSDGCIKSKLGGASRKSTPVSKAWTDGTVVGLVIEHNPDDEDQWQLTFFCDGAQVDAPLIIPSEDMQRLYIGIKSDSGSGLKLSLTTSDEDWLAVPDEDEQKDARTITSMIHPHALVAVKVKDLPETIADYPIGFDCQFCCHAFMNPEDLAFACPNCTSPTFAFCQNCTFTMQSDSKFVAQRKGTKNFLSQYCSAVIRPDDNINVDHSELLGGAGVGSDEPEYGEDGNGDYDDGVAAAAAVEDEYYGSDLQGQANIFEPKPNAADRQLLLAKRLEGKEFQPRHALKLLSSIVEHSEIGKALLQVIFKGRWAAAEEPGVSNAIGLNRVWLWRLSQETLRYRTMYGREDVAGLWDSFFEPMYEKPVRRAIPFEFTSVKLYSEFLTDERKRKEIDAAEKARADKEAKKTAADAAASASAAEAQNNSGSLAMKFSVGSKKAADSVAVLFATPAQPQKKLTYGYDDDLANDPENVDDASKMWGKSELRGQLWKLGGSKGGVFSRQTWKRRTFIAVNGELRYMDDDNELIDNVWLGGAFIEKDASYPDKDSKPYGFMLSAKVRVMNPEAGVEPPRRNFILVADTPEDKTRWINGIIENVKAANLMAEKNPVDAFGNKY